MATDWIQAKPEGLLVVPAGIYLDPSKPVQQAIVSHAHGDHFHPGCKEIIGTPGTIALLKTRIHQGKSPIFKTLPYRTEFTFGGVTFTLLPAGHIPGSAMICMTWQGMRALYTGDFNPQPHPMAEPLEYPEGHIDLLITESTFSGKTFTQLSPEEEWKSFRERIPQGMPALLGVYALGKAQRMIRTILDHDLQDLILVHPFIQQYHEVYQSLGFLPGEVYPYRKKRPEKKGHTIVLMPPTFFRRMAQSGKYHAAFVSGWDKRNKQAGIVDWLKISDHPDRQQLCAFIEKINPGHLWPIHGDFSPLEAWAKEKGIGLAT